MEQNFICKTSIYSAPINDPDVSKLKEKNSDLISFYVAETKAIVNCDMVKKLTDMSVSITPKPLYGWFDTYSIEIFRDDINKLIKDINELIETIMDSNNDNNDISELIEFLRELLNLLESILSIIWSMTSQDNNGSTSIVGADKLEKAIKNILAKIETYKKNRMNIPKEVENLLNALLDKIKKKLQPISIVPVKNILGVFYPDSFSIVLSKPNIEDWIDKKVDYWQKLLDVYSHELFHAFHYLYVTSIEYWIDIGHIVKESLARYIEFRYCMKHIGTPEIVCNHMQSWDKNDMYDFPYSGAKYLNKVENLCESIFKTSIINFNSAFLMIDSFYEREENIIDCSVCEDTHDKPLKMVIRYISDHPEIETYADLMKVFPSGRGIHVIVKEKKDITSSEMGIGLNKKGQKNQPRYFMDNPVLPNVYVSNQWSDDDVKELADFFEKNLGYKVKLYDIR